jgi:hypothetical protein
LKQHNAARDQQRPEKNGLRNGHSKASLQKNQFLASVPDKFAKMKPFR